MAGETVVLLCGLFDDEKPVTAELVETAMECEPVPSIASSFADNVSTGLPSFAINSSRKRRRMRARPV
jgi:hypothetical protein